MRVAIATCEDIPVEDADAEPVIAALGAIGVEAEMGVWSDPGVGWSGFDRVWVSSIWDYHDRLEEFRGWLGRVSELTWLENPAELIEWNLDKRYLRELEAEGVPVVPTVWTDLTAGTDADDAAREQGWERIVVKPTVDLGAINLSVVGPGEVEGAVAGIAGASMVQPFLSSLAEEGELSLVYMRGELSHTVRKVPREGDFRVQESYGGRYALEPADAEAEEIGSAVLSLLDGRGSGGAAPLYARIDLVRGLDGDLRLIEVELIEPNLFLREAGAEAAARFAALLAA